ncbi:MAG: hypothetical protein E6I27_02100 [Chloroflexi bacterium]|nr:MAG: hypothetical protein E6I27_02100 [Chloroflexota bacterium]
MATETPGDRKPATGAHQVSWRDSAEITERIRIVVYPMWLERQPASAILHVLNAWAARAGFAAYALSTVYDDLKRCETLAGEEQAATSSKVIEHIAATRRRLAQIDDLLSDESISPRTNAELFNSDLRFSMWLAKLDGALEQGARYLGIWEEAMELPARSQ